MFFTNWKKDLFTIPNLLSLFRLALIPVYMTVYLEGHYFPAGAILALSCLTDLLDGWIARRFDLVTEVGKLLDPLADKVTQLSLAVCLSLRYPIMEPVVLLLAAKEAFQLTAGLYYLRRGKILSHALLPGRICTAVLFLSLTSLVLMSEMPASMVNLLALADLAALSLSFLSYVHVYFSRESAQFLQGLE